MLTEARRRLDGPGTAACKGGRSESATVIGNSLFTEKKRATLIGLDGRLPQRRAGLGEGLTSFADRLAGLRGQDRPLVSRQGSPGIPSAPRICQVVCGETGIPSAVSAAGLMSTPFTHRSHADYAQNFWNYGA